jgi:ankyrin repeat protein
VNQRGIDLQRSRSTDLVVAAVLILWPGPPLAAQTPPTDLIDAINKRDEPGAARLLKQVADPNARDALTQPAITAAAYVGLEKTVRALLASGADAALVNSERRSALRLAESEGHQAVVKLLAGR